MRIGIAGPITIAPFEKYLQLGSGQDKSLPVGLGGTPVVTFVETLLERGHQVVVYTLAHEVTVPCTYAGSQLTIHVGRYRKQHQGRDFFALERKDLLAAMRSDPCDFIHAHWTYEFSLGALSSGIPTVTTIHDLPWNVLRYFRDPHRAVRLLMAYEVALRGKYFTAVSEDAASHFRRYFKPGANISVIPNGLPDSFFEIGNQSLQRSGEAVTFATILQGWSRRKNGADALRAFKLALRDVPNARLLMYGLDYEEGGLAHKWAIQQGLDAGVTFVGMLAYLDLLKRVHEEVDVIVHPSLDESFCLAALEGMALRKPVIAGRATPGVREVLGSGSAGVLVDVRDPAAIAKAMVRLARDQDYYNGVATAGYDRAWTLYRLEGVVTQYEALYRNLFSARLNNQS